MMMNFINFLNRRNFLIKSFNNKNGHYNHISSFRYTSSSSSTLANFNYPIANSSIVRHTMDGLISLHEYLNIPWFLEISIITIMARSLVAFPLTVLQRKIMIRYEALRPEIQILSKNLRNQMKEEAYLLGLSSRKTEQIYRKTLTREINRLIVRDNCHPMKATLVALFQIPMWIVLSNCYRNFALLQPDPNDVKIMMAHEQLQHEGLFWFKDLTIPDSTGILPIATCLVNLTIIQIHINERRRNNLQDSLFVRIFTNSGRLISVALVPIGLMMPSDMCFYWFISSSMGLVQNVLLMNPKVKKLLKIQK
ncbi:cytochrome c oxidase assembly protein COX18, mitochondrial [Dermatophagoides farinae]|uniref:cytochrome c oxidase assembly protein COX18, mitochondrial n=1 Tax=Dermatophagoides farinae TaxID=6954 RepID=UPI003F616847